MRHYRCGTDKILSEMVDLRIGLRFPILVIKWPLVPHVEKDIEDFKSRMTGSVLEK